MQPIFLFLVFTYRSFVLSLTLYGIVPFLFYRLFETHNNINIRLRKERIDLELEPEELMTETDVVWPPVASCTKCWLSEGTRWDEMEIYKYLQYIYWQVVRSLSNV